MKTIFDKGSLGRCAITLPKLDVPEAKLESDLLRDELNLPELSELDVVRHYTELSRRNFGIDNGFYPLGSCTMKYNPKINEEAARLEGFSQVHPMANVERCQGALKLIFELVKFLKEITGMYDITVQPCAGSHGELLSVMVMKAYFEDLGEKRSKILIPDAAHGTNPASVAMCGYECVEVKSNLETGCVDIDDLKSKMSSDVAGMMLTNPNTLGLFEKNLETVISIVHNKGGIMYCDGANANANLGVARVADLGFDMLHLNLHKSFSTPHGGGGPGAGAVGVVEKLAEFLPNPKIVKKEDMYDFGKYSKSIGRISSFYGNFGMLVRAYTYIRTLGPDGIRKVAENSVLNANYMMAKLKEHYNLPFDKICQHEFVINDEGMPNHITTNDIAKRLLDFGVYAPTIYFPLIVSGAMMIEPTECESKETMDDFVSHMIKIKKEAKENPDLVKKAPHNTPVGRVDAVLAARKPNLRWKKSNN